MTASDSAGPVPIEALLAHREWVRALARRLHADENRADDAEQETWRKALERPPRHAGAVRSWLARVVRNTAASAGRRERTRADRESAAPVRPPAASPADVVAEAEVHSKLIRAVLDLDEPYRSTILFRLFHGLECAEIAARTGVPVETVRTRVKRAIERLRTRMTSELGDDADAWCLLIWGRRGRVVEASAATAAGGALMASAMLKTAAAAAAAAALAIGAVGTWWMLDARDGATAADRSLAAAAASTPMPVAPRAPRNVASAADAAAETPQSVPRLVGRVLDPLGAAAAGVRVVFLPERPDATVDLSRASGLAETRTGEDGEFSAQPLASPGLAAVVALRDDGASARGEAIRPGEPVDLRLLAPTSIAGRVTDAEGVAVAGAGVTAGCLLDVGSLVRETRSQSDGSYRLAGLPASRGSGDAPCVGLQVTFSADGFAPLVVPTNSPETRLVPGGETRIDVELRRGAVVVGTVVEAESGRPVHGASLELVWESGCMGLQLSRGRSVGNPFARTTIATAVSAADGSFRFEHVPVADARSWAARVGVVRATKPGLAVAEADVASASDGSRIDVRLALRRFAAIVGRVVDRSGAPVPGLKVWAQVGGERNADSATSDEAGRYRLARLPAPGAADASAIVHAFRSYEERDLFAGENCHAEVHVAAGADSTAPDMVWDRPSWPVVRFLFVDEDGAPVRDTVVESPGDAIARLHGDDAGRAELVVRPIPANWPRPWPSQHVVVRAPGRAPAGVAIPPEPADGQEIRVVLGRGRTVSGRVLSAEGTPRAGALVRAVGGDVDLAIVFDLERTISFDSLAQRWADVPFLATTNADAEGSFVLRDLPEGPFTVGASQGGPGQWTGTRDVRGGAEGLVLRLPDAESAAASIGVRVTLEVKDETGAAVPATAMAMGAGGFRRSGRLSSAEIRTDAGAVVYAVRGLARPSAFRHWILAAGRYSARVMYPGGESLEQPFEIVAGRTTEVPVGVR